ncbi:MAG: tetratricopeptide repeat protein [Bacteroidales bacterium]|nr:tetratricopeptide repeat protein [Bacteroidales bacterium]
MSRTSIYLILIASTLLSCSKTIVSPALKPARLEEDVTKYNYFYVEGLRNKLIGSASEALALFEECIRIDPTRDGAYYQIAQISFVTGNLDNAVRYGQKALQISQNEWYYSLLGTAYYQTGKIDSAILTYQQALESYPEKDELKFVLGNMYYESGEYEQALDIFDFFDRKYGIAGNSAIPLVNCLIKLKRFNEAEKKLEILSGLYPEEESYMGMLAELYRDSGQADKAQSIYERLISDNPDDIVTLYSITDFLRKENNYNGLFSLFNTIALKENISEEDKVTYFAAQLEDPQIILNYSREFELSLLVLEAAHSKSSVAGLLRPELYSKTGRKKEAALLLEAYLISWPESYYAWEKLLIIYADEKMYGELYASSSAAIRRFNTAILPRLLNAVASLEEGLYDETLEQLVRLKRLSNNDKALELQLLSLEADAYYRKGDAEKAFSKYDEALSLDPDDMVVLNNYAFFLAERGERLGDARKMIEKVMLSEESNNTYNDTYAWVLYKKGKLKRAEEIMKKIIESEDNSDAEYYEHYGFILKARGKCEDAVISWRKALDLDNSKSSALVTEIDECLAGKK